MINNKNINKRLNEFKNISILMAKLNHVEELKFSHEAKVIVRESPDFIIVDDNRKVSKVAVEITDVIPYQRDDDGNRKLTTDHGRPLNVRETKGASLSMEPDIKDAAARTITCKNNKLNKYRYENTKVGEFWLLVCGYGDIIGDSLMKHSSFDRTFFLDFNECEQKIKLTDFEGIKLIYTPV